MYDSIDHRSRHLVPGLAGIYAALDSYSWPLVRAATGLFFVPHGMQKLFGFWGGDLAKTAAGFAKQGLEPGMFWATYIGCLELFGGLLLAIGLLTRPVAALFCGFMFVAAFHVTIQRGWFWSNGGMEVSLYLLLICLAILVRGGAPGRSTAHSAARFERIDIAFGPAAFLRLPGI
jgi:putative oxidoreductase